MHSDFGKTRFRLLPWKSVQIILGWKTPPPPAKRPRTKHLEVSGWLRCGRCGELRRETRTGGGGYAAKGITLHQPHSERLLLDHRGNSEQLQTACPRMLQAHSQRSWDLYSPLWRWLIRAAVEMQFLGPSSHAVDRGFQSLHDKNTVNVVPTKMVPKDSQDVGFPLHILVHPILHL